MKKGYLTSIIIVILLFSNLITRIKLGTSHKKVLQVITNLNKCDSLSRMGEKNLLLKQYRFDLLSKKMLNSILDGNGELSSFLNGENKLIIYFDENVCKSCILSLVMDLEILADEIGPDKIILAGSFKNQEDLEVLTKSFQSNLKSIIVRNIKVEGYPSEGPLIFLVDSDLNVKLFYSPETYPEIKKLYFQEVLRIMD